MKAVKKLGTSSGLREWCEFNTQGGRGGPGCLVGSSAKFTLAGAGRRAVVLAHCQTSLPARKALDSNTLANYDSS